MKKKPLPIHLSSALLSKEARQAAGDSDEENLTFNIGQLKARLNSEHERLIVELNSTLRNLQQRTAMAIEALNDGKPLDAHLIVNAGGISELIAKWNLVRDLIPYVNSELTK